MIKKQVILDRIEELLIEAGSIITGGNGKSFTYHETQFYNSIYGTVSLLKLLYQDKTDEETTLLDFKSSFIKNDIYRLQWAFDTKANLISILENMKSDITLGLLTSLEKQVTGEVYGDMVSMAKRLIQEKHKESASVLACGALEDSLKKYAIQKGLDVYEAELSQVVNALKASSFLKGTQAGLVQSYVKLRNKAFHAQFDQIEMPEVTSLIAFVEHFLIENF